MMLMMYVSEAIARSVWVCSLKYGSYTACKYLYDYESVC